MFERLFEILVETANGAKPWVVISAYQEGVLLRFGKYRRTLPPGIHALIPFADTVDEVVTVWTTVTLPVQSITTSDGKLVIAKGMIKFRISDSKVYALEVYDAKDALSDTTCKIIFKHIHSRTLSQCNEPDIMEDAITIDARKEAKKCGITVNRVTLTDFGEIKSFRLLNEGANIT